MDFDSLFDCVDGVGDDDDDDDYPCYMPIEPIVKVEEAEGGTSDDEIVPSAFVEPILLKPESGEEEEIVLDMKPDPDSECHERPHPHLYNQEQPWPLDVVKRTIRELRMRELKSRLLAVQARRRANLLLGHAGISKSYSHMSSFQSNLFTAKYSFKRFSGRKFL